jgi:hypothetical protein
MNFGEYEYRLLKQARKNGAEYFASIYTSLNGKSPKNDLGNKKTLKVQEFLPSRSYFLYFLINLIFFDLKIISTSLGALTV